MRHRDPSRLTSGPYDVLVIGGGIYGLFCAYEGASRGLHVALVEAGDFGSGASFNHQKTVHGGLRSLQTLAVRRAREAVHERRALARIAPWLLRPLPFLVGTYRSVTRGRLALRAAFALDRWIGRDRNEGVEPELHLPAPRLLSPTTTRKLFPGIREANLTGGAQWYDYQMVENDRLTFAVAEAADRAGADMASYVSATAAARADGLWTVHVHDRLADANLDVRARTVVNAAGAHAGAVMQMLGVSRPFPLIHAFNLVTTRPASDIALAAPGPDGRMLTLVPWRGCAIVGTGQSTSPARSPDDGMDPAEIERFVRSANHAFPALGLTTEHIRLVHHGLVPALVGGDARADLLPTSSVVDHAGDGAENAFTIVGAKYTTARGIAERVVDRIARRTGKSLRRSGTATMTLPGAGIADHEALIIETARQHRLELALPLIRHLAARYAEGAARIVSIMAADPSMADPLAPGSTAVRAEVVYAIRHESAVRLSDIVLRRTTLGASGHPGAALRTAASLARAELGWDAAREADEIASVERVYNVNPVAARS